MDSNFSRRKAAMVLHELERALGNYILNTEITLDNFPDEVIRNVVKRETERHGVVNLTQPQDIIEATYLDEIFNIILEITKDTSVSSYLIKLKQKFILYGIYEIRNVISHPNRKFIDTYWYRVASIASDPIIDILGMTSVKQSLYSAEEGELTDPPNEWMEKIIWEIPNNLPNTFEHGITGLVGRKKEEDDLLKMLKNGRVNNIAIVAQGGIGKTSLVLEFLSNSVKLPETKDYFDSCVFATLKTEKLTHEGVVKLEAIESIEELKKAITKESSVIYGQEFSSFESLCSQKSTERVLLFIDNLETLLIDSESDFQEFNYSLPSTWRVLVTSRVSISNSTIISLEPLKEKSALHLAKVYLSRKNHRPLDEKILVDLVKKCYCNPLAIRLTIDLYLSGNEFPKSISAANKEITSFSFANLIETLSDNSISILEALFLSDNLGRASLCELLSLSIEELSEGIAQLSKTSLINRSINEGGENYKLSDSIRELLLTNPRNIILRDKIQADMKKRKAISKQIETEQIRNSIQPYHWDYIPKDINENLKILLTEINRSFKGMSIVTNKAIALIKKTKEAEHLYKDISIFNRSYARLLSALNAAELAESKYRLAISQDNNDVNSKIFLAMHFHNSAQYNLSYEIYKNLIVEGWADEDNFSNEFVTRIINGFYFSLLYDHRYEDILTESKEWKRLTFSKGIVGVFRATALRRLSEQTIDNDPVETAELLTRSMRTFNEVFRSEGYIKQACEQAKNLMSSLVQTTKDHKYKSVDKYLDESLEFIATHITLMSNVINFNDSDEVIKLVKRLADARAENNPFKSIYIKGLVKNKYFEFMDVEDLNSKGLIIVSITNIPRKKEDFSPYIFGVNEGKNYFLHREFLQNGDKEMWQKIATGDKLAVKPNELVRPKDGKAHDVTEIYFIG